MLSLWMLPGFCLSGCLLHECCPSGCYLYSSSQSACLDADCLVPICMDPVCLNAVCVMAACFGSCILLMSLFSLAGVSLKVKFWFSLVLSASWLPCSVTLVLCCGTGILLSLCCLPSASLKFPLWFSRVLRPSDHGRRAAGCSCVLSHRSLAFGFVAPHVYRLP